MRLAPASIANQRHKGPRLLPDLYDDGGLSGATMDRPGLKRLMAEFGWGAGRSRPTHLLPDRWTVFRLS